MVPKGNKVAKKQKLLDKQDQSSIAADKLDQSSIATDELDQSSGATDKSSKAFEKVALAQMEIAHAVQAQCRIQEQSRQDRKDQGMVELYIKCGMQDHAQALLMRMVQEEDARRMPINPPIDLPLTMIDVPNNNDDEDST